jgi:hypothetical protein
MTTEHTSTDQAASPLGSASSGLGAGSEARSYPACKGTNCGCTDGISHSATCVLEHDDAVHGAIVGQCSVPMFSGYGCPSGFCDRPAWGKVLPQQYYRDAWTGEERTITGRLRSYATGLACVVHGGPEAPNAPLIGGDSPPHRADGYLAGTNEGEK